MKASDGVRAGAWSPEMAAALVTAGFRSLAKVTHPDRGETHEDMVALTATADRLQAAIAAGLPTAPVGPTGPVPPRDPSRVPPLVPYDEGWLYRDDVVVRAATARALRCRFPGGVETWIPRSQLHADCAVFTREDRGRLVLSVRLATRKGWWR
jgi:hypothetical protein